MKTKIKRFYDKKNLVIMNANFNANIHEFYFDASKVALRKLNFDAKASNN